MIPAKDGTSNGMNGLVPSAHEAAASPAWPGQAAGQSRPGLPGRIFRVATLGRDRPQISPGLAAGWRRRAGGLGRLAPLVALTALVAWAGPLASATPPVDLTGQESFADMPFTPSVSWPAETENRSSLSSSKEVSASANRPLRLCDEELVGPVWAEAAEPHGLDESDSCPSEVGPPVALAAAGAPRVLEQALGVLMPATMTLPLSDGDDQEPPPADQAARRADDQIIESIQVRGEKTEQLIVPRNSSAVINLKQKVDGVEISDPNIADVLLTSPNRIIVTGKSYGTTQLVLRIGMQQRTLAVTVELDLRMLSGLIKSIAPTSDVQLRSISGTVVLMGHVPDVETSQRVVELATLAQGGEVRNQLTIAGVQQTMLRVVVAEVNKTALRTLGVNWAIGGSDWSRDFFFANNLNQINPTVFTSSGLGNVLAPSRAVRSLLSAPPVTGFGSTLFVNEAGQLTYALGAVGNGPNTNVTFGFPRGEFQLFMNALRENQLARILAEPNLVAINGQTATFLAGGEVPIPVTQGGAVAGSITIEYKEFGVRLGFTPTVLGGQIIRLHVMSEVSDAVPGPVVAGALPVFTFTTRRVESTVECGNGQTFAIAGLLREQVRSVADKIPGLGDLPVLGSLFSSVRYQKDDTEMVVLVTPQLVEPLEPHQVGPPPGSLMRDPNDFELFALGQLEGTPQAPPEFEGVPRDELPVNTHPPSTGTWTTTQIALHGPWGLSEVEEE